MHRKAINPLQELIWSTPAYLLWHGHAFTYPLGRSKKRKKKSCFKPWQQPRISTDFIFTKQLPAMVINAGLLDFNSLWHRLHCRLCKLQWFITESHCTASSAKSIHTNDAYTHTYMHMPSCCSCHYSDWLWALCILERLLRDLQRKYF